MAQVELEEVAAPHFLCVSSLFLLESMAGYACVWPTYFKLQMSLKKYLNTYKHE